MENLIKEQKTYLESIKTGWVQLFPIEEDPIYKETICIMKTMDAKLNRVKNELVKLIEKGP